MATIKTCLNCRYHVKGNCKILKAEVPVFIMRKENRLCGPTAAFHTSITDSCKGCYFFENNLCLAFGSQDPVSGTINYSTALEARTNSWLCGIDQQHYMYKNVPKDYTGYLD